MPKLSNDTDPEILILEIPRSGDTNKFLEFARFGEILEYRTIKLDAMISPFSDDESRVFYLTMEPQFTNGDEGEPHNYPAWTVSLEDLLESELRCVELDGVINEVEREGLEETAAWLEKAATAFRKKFTDALENGYVRKPTD